MRAASPAVAAWLAASCTAFALGNAAPVSQSFEAFRFVSGFFGLDAGDKKGGDARRLEVIGAGFSRTGTKSIDEALRRLGHKVYDTRSVIELGHAAGWEEAARQYRASGNVTLLEEMLGEMEAQGYTATLDFPMNLFAPVFADLRPSAKVLMSVRPSLDSWFDSMASTYRKLGFLFCRPWSWLIAFDFPGNLCEILYDFDMKVPTYPENIWRPVPWFEFIESYPGLEDPEMRGAWKHLHRRLQSDLETKLPKERFTTYDVRSGWSPLLSFLGVEDPVLAAGPFPQVNARSTLQAVSVALRIAGAGLPLWLLLSLWLLRCCASCLWRCCANCLCRRCWRSAPKDVSHQLGSHLPLPRWTPTNDGLREAAQEDKREREGGTARAPHWQGFTDIEADFLSTYC